jgi:hypothetical protein
VLLLPLLQREAMHPVTLPCCLLLLLTPPPPPPLLLLWACLQLWIVQQALAMPEGSLLLVPLALLLLLH